MEFKICRVCLDRSATISVFDKQDDTQYYVKIMKCANVTITEGDGFPDSICEGCAADLTVSFDFTQRCQASDKALRCLDLLQTADHEPDSALELVTYKQEIKPEDEAFQIQNEDSTHCDSFLANEQLVEVNARKYIEETNDNNLKKCSKKLLPEHLRTRRVRLQTGPIPCTLCKRVLVSYSAYVTHMRTHTKERPYSCDICKKSYPNKNTMKRHILKHYGIIAEKKPLKPEDKRGKRPKIGPFQCAICGRMINSNSAMQNHMRTHTGEKPFACEVCGMKYRLKGSLKRHMQCAHSNSHNDTSFTCEHCGKTFMARSNIITHMRIHTGEKPYLCQYCPKSFKQASALVRHRRGHTGERPFTCETCGRSFNDRCLLNKHQSVHSADRNFSCHICNKAFKLKITLNTHLNTHTKAKLWVCNLCGKTFTFKGNLRTHMSRRHSEKSGVCTVCNKEFGDLEAHMRVHTGEKPYRCKICDQSYASMRSLSHHMGFKHRRSDKFRCVIDDCSKTFPTASMLEFHVLKHHSHTTPYVCQHCERGFMRASDLSRHLKINHMDTQTKVKSHYINAT